jgi:hypothetical protein
VSPLRNALVLHLGQVLTPEVAAAIEGAPESSATPPWPRSSPAVILDLMGGNQEAADLVRMVADWSHTYDDLIDRDKPVTDGQIHSAMWVLLDGLYQNPFFFKHQATFRALLMSGVLNWHAANQMEQSGCVEQLRLAHVLRYAIADVALMAMYLAVGFEHAASNAAQCRLLAQQDTWANYFKEHQKC